MNAITASENYCMAIAAIFQCFCSTFHWTYDSTINAQNTYVTKTRWLNVKHCHLRSYIPICKAKLHLKDQRNFCLRPLSLKTITYVQLKICYNKCPKWFGERLHCRLVSPHGSECICLISTPSNTWFLRPHQSANQTATQSVQPFCTVSPCEQCTNSHRHTDHATCNICRHRPLHMHSVNAMQPNNMQT